MAKFPRDMFDSGEEMPGIFYGQLKDFLMFFLKCVEKNPSLFSSLLDSVDIGILLEKYICCCDQQFSIISLSILKHFLLYSSQVTLDRVCEVWFGLEDSEPTQFLMSYEKYMWEVVMCLAGEKRIDADGGLFRFCKHFVNVCYLHSVEFGEDLAEAIGQMLNKSDHVDQNEIRENELEAVVVVEDSDEETGEVAAIKNEEDDICLLADVTESSDVQLPFQRKNLSLRADEKGESYSIVGSLPKDGSAFSMNPRRATAKNSVRKETVADGAASGQKMSKRQMIVLENAKERVGIKRKKSVSKDKATQSISNSSKFVAVSSKGSSVSNRKFASDNMKSLNRDLSNVHKHAPRVDKRDPGRAEKKINGSMYRKGENILADLASDVDVIRTDENIVKDSCLPGLFTKEKRGEAKRTIQVLGNNALRRPGLKLSKNVSKLKGIRQNSEDVSFVNCFGKRNSISELQRSGKC